jgi:AP-3 complex subunit mu
MLSAVFLANPEGVVLIEKQYREHVDRSRLDAALSAIANHVVPPPPVITSGDSTVLLQRQGDIWILGVCDGEDFILFGVTVVDYVSHLLHQLAPVKCDENAIKSSFPAIYQMLDYAIDFGFPFLNESNTIRTVISRPLSDPSRGVKTDLDFEMPWRSVGIDRLLNSFGVEVYETIDLIVSAHGRIEHCHIRGAIHAKSMMSGSPHLRLTLSGRPKFDDATFHRCVGTDNIDAKVLSFVPPDGLFTLMTYRVTITQSEFPVWAVPKFAWVRGCMTFEITVRVLETLSTYVDDVEVRFEVPHGVSQPTMTAHYGQMSYDIGTREVIWTIGLHARKEALVLKGSATTDHGFEVARKSPTVTVGFLLPGATVSRLAVEDIALANDEYQWTKSAQYSSRTGSYEFRTSV